jgi:hypothetical protein
MKPIVSIAVLATLLLVTPGPCFALWMIALVGKEEAKKLGVQVRTTADGPGRVLVKLEFKTDGALKGFSRVELRGGKGADSPLQVDRSKPGRASAGFAADREGLDKITMRVMVPDDDGGTIYQIRMSDFAETK